MSTYRKKPITVEAFQMTEEHQHDQSEWPAWLREAWQERPGDRALWLNPDPPNNLCIGTLVSALPVDPDDWIIQGVAGELHPVKNDIFLATYDKVVE